MTKDEEIQALRERVQRLEGELADTRLWVRGLVDRVVALETAPRHSGEP